MADQQLFGRYQVIERLGAGGFGDVFLAHDPKHDRRVAIKVLKANQADPYPEETQARFIREIKVVAEVRSPHVVTLHGAGVHDEQPYLVMEYVEGQSVGDLLEEVGKLEVGTGINVGRAVAAGLLAIHSKRLVHRDIKPDNILLGYDSTIKIIDFGLAKFFMTLDGQQSTQLTMADMALGSPHYISPEAAEDAQSAGPKADCYSFGATMFHVFAGQPVFDDDNPMKLLLKHLKEPPPSLGDFLPQANKLLIKTIDRCLLKKPGKRPTAMQLADVFKHL